MIDSAPCVICGGPPTTLARPSAIASSPMTLCAQHSAEYRTDWLLVGWCAGGHYGQALRRCPAHGSELQPL